MVSYNRSLIGLLGIVISLFMASCGKDDPERVAAKDREKILEYIQKNEIEAIEHESGVFYFIEQQSTDKYPQINSTVDIIYEGRLLDGKVFESKNRNPSFPLYRAILGWQYGVPLFSKGSKGKLLIPSGLGYGQYPQMGIPANSVLIFDIEIIDF